MKIRDMELLVRVAETGSMTVAARQLHLTPAAVSAAVQRVEASLGLRLFERTTRSLHATEDGLVVLEGCADVVARWTRTLDEARGAGAELEGHVHLSAPADTTYQLLEDGVAELAAAHPRLRVVLWTSDAIQQLHRDAIDMAIRYGALPDSGLTARRLVQREAILVASPEYLQNRGAPEHPRDLAQHDLVTLQRGGSPTLSWSLRRSDGEDWTVPVDSPLCGNGYLSRRWALAGRGVAYKNLFDVIDDLEAGTLRRVLPDWSGGLVPIHAVFPSRRFLPARVRALDAAIGARFAARDARCARWLGEA